jgi:superfamily I DNA and/or RNA helicase
VDHKSVICHPDVKGVSRNVAFISHTVHEDGAQGDSDNLKTKVNTHEAELCLEIVRYLLLQGYLPRGIVVLTPYVGQLLLITRLMRQNLSEVTAYSTLARAI